MASERKVHLDSRVLMLVDTSLSMARLDPDTPGGLACKSRLQQVAAGLDDTEFIARLRKKHQVSPSSRSIVFWKKTPRGLALRCSLAGREGRQ